MYECNKKQLQLYARAKDLCFEINEIEGCGTEKISVFGLEMVLVVKRLI
ncbi:hypothetical protein GCM10010294_70980 [Streptomyces griseoloalbus]|nr:hypothetical protein GCM10010294_70980 [Streptomyces griseoloalbus]